MNAEQLGSLIRTLLKIAAALLAQRGLSDAAGILNGPDAAALVCLLVALPWSHAAHSKSSKTGGGSSALLFLLAGSLCVAPGCASVNQSVTASDGSKTSSTIFAIWPATSTVEKANANQTKTTQRIGVAGVDADGGGTNGVAALHELSIILSNLPK